MTNTLLIPKTQFQQLDHLYFCDFKYPNFWQKLIEDFIDGILILTEQRELIHANESALRICRQLSRGKSEPTLVPEAIWHICQFLIESRSLFPEQTIILSDDIVADNSIVVRIRVRRLTSAQFERPYLLVAMEEQCKSVQAMPIREAQKYSLTPRETDVWLLYRANYSYKQIAAQLYITLNTVKKHMKSIHAKRQLILANEDE